MSTNFGYLPPLPPIAAALAAASPASRTPSARWESLMAATIVLLAGVTVFMWATRLDTTDSQIFAAAAAAVAVFLPQATFFLLRATNRRQ